MFRSMEPPDCYTLRSAGLTLTLFSLKALGRLEAWRLRSLKAWRLEGLGRLGDLETWRPMCNMLLFLRVSESFGDEFSLILKNNF